VLFGESGEECLQLIARHSHLLDPRVRKHFVDGGLWLVRPDGYVAPATKSTQWDEAEVFLNTIAAPAASGHSSASV
jgi:hypothetical protein